MSQNRAVLIVLDSVGCGELPDAANFGDVGSHTLGHIAETVQGFDMPNMKTLGLGNIPGLEALGGGVDTPAAGFGKMIEVSQGKDTATGHWEFVGLIMEEPFRTFPNGFDDEIIKEFCAAIGVEGVLGNKAASGTVIIQELGEEHRRTGLPIVYTSADPVFQIAAHEDVVPLETLYAWCKAAYDIVIPRGQSRVIARPFVGDFPDYTRTSNRKDFALPPVRETMLDAISAAGVEVTGVGKISNIYAEQGVHHSFKTVDNDEGMAVTMRCVKERREGLIFTNLVDFDMKFGHRRNPVGYANALEEFDQWLPSFLEELEDGDLLLITADHGNDPTFPGTDHTREYVPIIALVKGQTHNVNLGVRDTFADVGATIADFFGVDWHIGESFLGELK